MSPSGISTIQKARLLHGPGTGRSDSIPAVIDGRYPAALSSGEVVIPEDAVNSLGGGDTSRGAKLLQMLVSKIRAGNAQQIAQMIAR